MHEERSYHRISEDLETGSLEKWAASGITQIEAYLAKHAAFLAYLDGDV